MEGVQTVRRNHSARKNELHEDIRNTFPTAMVGDYKIIKYLGWGEQGTTLILEDCNGDKHLGKIFEGSFNLSKYKRAQKNLARGIEISRQLHHPCIPEYHDMVELEDKKQFVVIREYVEGKSLEDLVGEKGHLGLDELRPILDGALQCLEYLQDSSEHPEVGVVCHRDINPKHIIVGDDGKVSLIDLDTLKDSESGATQLTSVGTKKYAHPNALIGEASPAYDVFSLGFSIVEALLGEIPEDMDKSRMYGGKVYELPGWVDGDLGSILNKMIDPNEDCDAREIINLLNHLEEDYEEETELNISERKGFPDFFEGREDREYLEDLWKIVVESICEGRTFMSNPKRMANPYLAFDDFRAGYLQKECMGCNATEIFKLFNEKGLNDANQKRMNSVNNKILDEISYQLDQYLIDGKFDEARKNIKELKEYFNNTINPAYGDICRNNLVKTVELTKRDKEILGILPLKRRIYWDICDLENNFEEMVKRNSSGEKVKNSWIKYVSAPFSLNYSYVDRYRSEIKDIMRITKKDEFDMNSLEKRLNRYRKLAGFNEEHKPYVMAMRKLSVLNE